MRVKICGITNLDDARLCVAAGADALGFNFVEGTPRFVTPEAAARIVAALPPFVTPVGVFWNHAAGHVKAVAEQCGLGALQFHGDEAPEDLHDFRLPVIKVLKVAGPDDLDAHGALPRGRVPARLARALERGRGPAGDSLGRGRGRWRAGIRCSSRPASRPDNVGEAVRRVRPYGGGRQLRRGGATRAARTRRGCSAS